MYADQIRAVSYITPYTCFGCHAEHYHLITKDFYVFSFTPYKINKVINDSVYKTNQSLMTVFITIQMYRKNIEIKYSKPDIRYKVIGLTVFGTDDYKHNI